MIEAALSAFESDFAKVIPSVLAGDELDEAQYRCVVTFLGILRSRLPGHLEHWQRQFGNIERVYRMVERAATGKEAAADREFWMKDEMAKRMLFEMADSYARVIGPGGWLIANDTPLPLLTADIPALHMFLHRDELERVGFTEETLNPEATRADSAFFSYCPLSPFRAFVSSPLLIPPQESLYWSTKDPRIVLMLNELMRNQCDEVMISPLADPYGPLTPLLIELDAQATARRAASSGMGVALYTDTDRRWIPCDRLVFEDGPTPLQTRLRFAASTDADVTYLREGMILREVTAFDNWRRTGGFRGARIQRVAGAGSPDTIIEADPALAV